MVKSKVVTEKEFKAYQKKHMAFHRREEKEDVKIDKKLIDNALKKAGISKRK